MIKTKSVRDIKLALAAVYAYYRGLGITKDFAKNKKVLSGLGYRFSDSIITTTISGQARTIAGAGTELESAANVEVFTSVSTHAHGRLYHQVTDNIARKSKFEYDDMNRMFRRLFLNNLDVEHKIISLGNRQLYSFVINNDSLIEEAIQKSNAKVIPELPLKQVKTIPTHITFPREIEFAYDSGDIDNAKMTHNVYEGYLSSASPRWLPEKRFEHYCENSPVVDWFHKNGDRDPGTNFSLVFLDNFGYQKHFFPDYVVSVKGQLWLIETKGGFTAKGGTQDIDIFSPKKFISLRAYLSRHTDYKGGFVRFNDSDDKLYIATDIYTEEFNSVNWKLLSKVFV